MKFGIHYLLSCAENQSPVQRYQDTIEQAVYAEQLGFESVWPAEQHFDQRVCSLPCPSILLGAIAARTRTLRLGTGIVQLPLHHPMRVAEELATLDVLSNGRVEVGVGRGSNPDHFAGYGIDMSTSRERFVESLDYLKVAWEKERFSFDGRHVKAQDACLSPEPVQRWRLPLHVAVNSPDTAEWAGRAGHRVIVAMHVNPGARLDALLAAYHRARAEAGHGPAIPDDVTVLMPLFVGTSTADLERVLSPTIARYVYLVTNTLLPAVQRAPEGPERTRLLGIIQNMQSTDFGKVNESMGMFDTPDGCVARIEALKARLGVGRLIGWFNFGGMVPHHRVMRSMELFATDVMPFFGEREEPEALSA